MTSSCCDSATCKFTSGALCDPKSSTCCTDSCQFAPTTQVCRPSKDAQCDFAESCTGSSSACPADKTQSDGTSCGSGLACASGTCTSLSRKSYTCPRSSFATDESDFCNTSSTMPNSWRLHELNQSLPATWRQIVSSVVPRPDGFQSVCGAAGIASQWEPVWVWRYLSEHVMQSWQFLRFSIGAFCIVSVQQAVLQPAYRG